jgi:hypothetical protein
VLDLAVTDAPVVVHGHRCLLTGGDRPERPPDEQVDVVLPGGKAMRGELGDLDAVGGCPRVRSLATDSAATTPPIPTRSRTAASLGKRHAKPVARAGNVKLVEVKVRDVGFALGKLAQRLSTRSVRLARMILIQVAQPGSGSCRADTAQGKRSSGD